MINIRTTLSNSMIAKTEAIALKVNSFSRTSHVVTWLTRSHGRLVTIVKGACRPKSAFLGQYDLFYTCELLYYEKERNGFHIAKECSPILTRNALRDNWRGFACASYVCDVIAKISFRNGLETGLYDLATTILDFLSCTRPRVSALFWFELRLLDAMGIRPRLTECAVCDGIMPASGSAWFSIPRGGVLCTNCKESRTEKTISVPADVLTILRRWQGASSPQVANNTKCDDAQIASLQQIIGMFLLYHLDMEIMPPSRNIATEMVRNP